MGYFSNGSEGDGYNETYCMRCVNWKDSVDRGEGCPVWDAHLMHNYNQEGAAREILSILIPRSSDGGNGKCAMFHSNGNCPGQEQLFLEQAKQ